ncbi:MAG: hypothetical protein JNM93_02570 [Bacteriovoracaceae bacterium]|nr:hypothetical protein [Bacteriovoracaceae bacterium]
MSSKASQDSINILKQNLLAMQLREVTFKDLLLLDMPLDDVYTFNDNQFFVIISEATPITRELIKSLLNEGVKTVFIKQKDLDVINNKLKNELLRVTRGLSVGNAKENGVKQINYLSKNMAELYKDPLNDENLKTQFQCTTNLSKLLIEHRSFMPEFYTELQKQSHHFTISQPMMASLLLMGFLQQFRLFHEKDIEMIFMTSYFKDIGMSFVPEEKLEKKGLDIFDRKIIGKHAENSLSILEGRVPFSRNHLNIIKNHHYLNERIKAIYKNENFEPSDKMLIGLETTIVAVMDVLVAMISDRPYRNGQTLFQSLELIKKIMADDYPLEYKALVNYLRYFFTKLG